MGRTRTPAPRDISGHHTGSIPNRSTKLTVSWGLLSVPCGVFTAVDSGEGARRHEYTADGQPLGQRRYNKDTGDLFDGDPVKMATASNGRLVPLTDDEIAEATGGPSKGAATIECFVPLDSVGLEYTPVDWHQIRPARLDRGGPNPGAEKAFALLLAVLADKQVGALIRFGFRGPARYAVILPDGRLVTVAYSSQMRARLPLPDVEIAGQERASARALLDAIGVATPVLVDEGAELLAAYIDAKAAGTTVVAPRSAASPTVDLMEALEASLAATKVAPPPRKPRRAAPRKRQPAGAKTEENAA